MAEFNNWRNFWWLNVALHAAIFLLSIVGFPETKWHRAHPKESLAVAPSSHSQSSDEPKEKADPDKPTAIEKVDTEVATGKPDLSKEATAMRDPYLGKGSPGKKQFNIIQPNAHPLKSIFLDIWIPWKLFAFPIVEFASFVVSWSASSFLTLNLTQSQVFAAPPYNFPPQSVGFTNFAVFVGSLIGLFTAGPMSDWISARLTKRNRGIREPEMRLLTMVPFVLVMLLGNFVVAFGYQYQWDWRVSVVFLNSETRVNLHLVGYSDNRLRLRWTSSRRSPIHRLYVCGRQLQACHRLRVRVDHCQQECLGIWLLGIYYSLVIAKRIYTTYYDQHVLDLLVV